VSRHDREVAANALTAARTRILEAAEVCGEIDRRLTSRLEDLDDITRLGARIEVGLDPSVGLRSAADRADVLDRSIASCRPMVQEITSHLNSAKHALAAAREAVTREDLEMGVEGTSPQMARVAFLEEVLELALVDVDGLNRRVAHARSALEPLVYTHTVVEPGQEMAEGMMVGVVAAGARAGIRDLDRAVLGARTRLESMNGVSDAATRAATQAIRTDPPPTTTL